MKKLVELLLMLCAAAIVALLIWGANKGFDLSDEGLYILNLLYPEETSPYWKYGFIYNQIFGWMGIEVIGYRVLKVILLLAASYFLAQELTKSKWIETSKVSLDLIGNWALVFLGSAACYAIGPPTLSYNDLTLIYSMAALAASLRFLRCEADNLIAKTRFKYLIVVGVFIGFLLFAKFSAAILMATCSGILFLSNALKRNYDFRKILKQKAAVFLGLVVAVVYHLISIGTFSEYLAVFKDSLGIIQGHDSISLYKTYAQSLRLAFVEGFIYYLEIPFILTILYLLKHKESIGNSLFNQLLLVVPVYLTIRFYFSDFHLSGTTNSLTAFNPFFTGLLLIGSVLVFERKKVQLSLIQIAIGAVLLLLPFLMALGTNNPLPLQASLFQVYWLLMFAFLLSLLPVDFKVFSRLVLLVFALISFSQTVHGYYFKPYRLVGTLGDQNKVIEKSELDSNLKLHPNSARFISKVDSILKSNCSLSSPHPIISMFNHPGTTYLLNGISPGSSWYKFQYDDLNCFNLSNSKIKNLNEAIILSQGGSKLREPFISCLNEKGLSFPEGYRVIAVVKHPMYDVGVFIMAPRSILKTN